MALRGVVSRGLCHTLSAGSPRPPAEAGSCSRLATSREPRQELWSLLMGLQGQEARRVGVRSSHCEGRAAFSEEV